MKLKNFFNNERRKAFIQELKNDFRPIVEKISNPVTAYAKNNPRTTFAFMMFVVITNIILLFIFTDSYKTHKGIEITDFKFQEFGLGMNKTVTPEITISFENIKKVKILKDSLTYLLSIKKMTTGDTLTFIRIMDEFQKVTSGSSGIPPINLDELRKTNQINEP